MSVRVPAAWPAGKMNSCESDDGVTVISRAECAGAQDCKATVKKNPGPVKAPEILNKHSMLLDVQSNVINHE